MEALKWYRVAEDTEVMWVTNKLRISLKSVDEGIVFRDIRYHYTLVVDAIGNKPELVKKGYKTFKTAELAKEHIDGVVKEAVKYTLTKTKNDN